MYSLSGLLEEIAPVMTDSSIMADGKALDIRVWRNTYNYCDYSFLRECQYVIDLYEKDKRNIYFKNNGMRTILSADNKEEAVKTALLLSKQSIENIMDHDENNEYYYDADEIYECGVYVFVLDLSKESDSTRNTYIELMCNAIRYTKNIIITGIGAAGISGKQMEAVETACSCFDNVFVFLDKRIADNSILSQIRVRFGFSLLRLNDNKNEEYERFIDCLLRLYEQNNGESFDPYISDHLPEIIQNINKKSRGNFTKETIVRFLESGDVSNASVGEHKGMKRLEKLVGLNEVKHVAKKLLATAYEVRLNQRLSMKHQNMLLVGNPGTGKSTVSEIIAEIIEESGVGNGCFVRVETKDLIGQYVGQTAPRVADCFARARGGVLFVDEAGALLDSTEYTKEAIKEFVRYMEQYPDVIVMFAMYPEEATGFLGLDYGLSSRIRHTISFENYTNDELYRIAKGMLTELGYKLPKGGRKYIDEYITSLRNCVGNRFGNAREMRKLVDEIVTELSLRHLADKLDVFDENVLCDDIRNAADNLLSQAGVTEKPRKTIGFAV